jgi:hypothetical protein
MATNQLSLDTTQSNQTRRAAAVEIIQEKFKQAKVKVLDPQEVRKGYEAGDSKLDPDIKADYNCVTEPPFDPSSAASILVGLFREFPRWKPGSTINFAAYADGYPEPEDAEFAALRLWEAAEEWNKHKLGVKFEWVGKLDEATFVLQYGGDNGTVLASAFFPNSQPVNTLFVYKLALQSTEKYRGMLKNIFLHELGHVLGLRHEFALDPDRFEGGAVVYGSRNEDSVMSYKFPPKLQESDITDVKSYYKAPIIKDYIPG